MAKAGLLFVGTADGVVLLSNPGAAGRWLRVGHELRGRMVAALWVWFDQPRLLLAATDSGIWRSDDGGVAWRAIHSSPASALAGTSGAEPVVVAALRDGSLIGYTPAADRWETISIAAGAILAAGGRLIVATDAAIAQSDDGGMTWAPCPAALPAVPAAIVALPNETLYATAAAQLWRSIPENGLWEVCAAPVAAGPLAALAGAQPALLLATADSIARSADAGATWADASVEAPIAPVTTIAPASYHMDTAFAGTTTGQLLLTTDRGRSWQLLRDGMPPISAIASARLA